MADPPIPIPAGATPEGDGVAVGSGPVSVDAFIDFLCPYCKRFEQRSGAALDRLVADGSVLLVYHPVAFLDRLSAGTRYSTRAAAAAGAAADAGRFAAYKDVLFAHQPQEGEPGLSDEQLVALGAEAGIEAGAGGGAAGPGGGTGADAGFAAAVAGGRFLPWSAAVTAAAEEVGVSGIPTVFVDGVQVPADGAAIAAAVARGLAAG